MLNMTELENFPSSIRNYDNFIHFIPLKNIHGTIYQRKFSLYKIQGTQFFSLRNPMQNTLYTLNDLSFFYTFEKVILKFKRTV